MKRATILLSIILLAVSCEKDENQILSTGEINGIRLKEYATQNNINKVAIFESFDIDWYGWLTAYGGNKYEFEIEKGFLILKSLDNTDIIYDLSKMLKFDHSPGQDFLNIYFF